MEVGWRSRAGGIRDSGKVGVWVGVGVGAGGVWRRVVVCAARRPVWVVQRLSVLFSYLILSYLAPSRRGAVLAPSQRVLEALQVKIHLA